LQLCDPKGCTPAPIYKEYRETLSRGNKIVPGYSRILTATKEEPDFDSLFKGTRTDTEKKKNTRNAKVMYNPKMGGMASLKSNKKLLPLSTDSAFS